MFESERVAPFIYRNRFRRKIKNKHLENESDRYCRDILSFIENLHSKNGMQA